MQPAIDAIQTSLSLPDLMTILLITGMLLLTGSLYIIHLLASELPAGANRNWWRLLTGLILLFIAGYGVFFYLKSGQHYSASEVIVPVIFFFGAVFVLLVCFLSYRTTINLKRIFSLEQEVITDPLLGIFNRRHLDRRLQEEVLRAQRHQLDLGLLVIDVDHFKQVNDTWGHQVGDLVLKHLSKVLLAELRQTDIFARYGGEEFVVLLPHSTSPETQALAERLCRVIERTPLQVTIENKTVSVPLTISIGSSCLQPDDDTAFMLMERTDKALYRAKQEGRNRVCCDEQARQSTPAGGE